MQVVLTAVQKNLLVEEVLIQASLASAAYDGLRQSVAPPETRQRREVWALIQSVLSHTAMISKFMKPTSKSPLSKARSSALKEIFKVNQNSPVFSRSARDNVEHLDERIDLWLDNHSQGMLECVFLSRDEYDFMFRSEAGEKRYFIKRVYLISDDIFISEGRSEAEEINLKELIGEVHRIKAVAELFLEEDSSVKRIYPV